MPTATKLETKACPACGGDGKIPGDEVGLVLREERQATGVTGDELAGAMGISAEYLYALERGPGNAGRRMSNELLKSYQSNLKKLANAKR